MNLENDNLARETDAAPATRIAATEANRELRTFKMVVSYDGTNYHGWQMQSGWATIQGTLKQALARVTGESLHIIGSGRTDAGVHALGQVASFRSATRLDPLRLQGALNAKLPDDIAVMSVEETSRDFHAIRSAIRKRYRYVIHDGIVCDVFRRRYCWKVRRRLNTEVIQRATAALIGTHDFRSYESQGSPRLSTVRTVFACDIYRGPAAESDFLYLEIEADGFLYNMVRSIVGVCEPVGRGARPESWPREVLAARDRRAAGKTAPAHGLCLLKVDYA